VVENAHVFDFLVQPRRRNRASVQNGMVNKASGWAVVLPAEREVDPLPKLKKEHSVFYSSSLFH
jgi:hypothetical protein